MPIAPANDKRYGIVKGQPIRYVKGHHMKKSPVDYIVDSKTGCWVWQRAVNSSGYGHLYMDGVHKYAHIHYYEMHNGPVENSGRTKESTQVHHSCGNKLCVNPEHLEAHGIEQHRREHGLIKVTVEQAEEMRALHRLGMRQADIAKKYGMSQSQTSAICRGVYRIG